MPLDSWKKNLYIVWASQILSLAGFGFMLPFLPFFMQEVGVTDPDALRRWVGLCSSIPAVGMGIMAPIWGILADKYGRKLMILRSMAAGSMLLLSMSFMRSVEGIFALRTIQGLLTGTIAASATLVAAGTPRERLSFALGFLSSSTFIGYALGPFIGGITAEFFGYRTAFRIGSAMLLVGFVVVVLLVKDMRDDDQQSPKQAEGSALDRYKPLALLLGMLFLLRFCRSLPYPFIPLHIQDMKGGVAGASAATGLLTSMVGLAAAVAGITIVRLGDRMNRLLLISLCLGATALVSLPLFSTRTVFSFGFVYVFMVFCSGAVEPTLQSHLSEQTDASKRGRLFGVQTLVASLGWFAAPLTGSAVAIHYGIRYVFLLTSVCFFAAFFYSLLMKRLSPGQRRPRLADSK